MAYWSELPKFQRWLILFGFVGLGIAQVAQPFPEVALFHHTPTLLFLLAAPLLLSRWPISNAALVCIFVFLALHTLGGRYTYTNTPYDQWFEALFGESLSSIFGWQRNHYDRLAHFSFGLLFVTPVVDILSRYATVSRRLALYIAVEFVMGVSAIYEVVEWGLSIILAPNNVEAYNGQQGDFWDAQKDMALAFTGALVAMVIIAFRTGKLKEVDRD
ncbi:MAG: DUF2238 domain-containing protein [Erythrobacter sp.]